MNKERLFIDTGAWLAITLTDDHYHVLANQTLSQILKSGTRLVTTNQIIGETYTFLAKIRSPKIALMFIEKVRTSAVLDLYFVNEDMELVAFEWLQRYSATTGTISAKASNTWTVPMSPPWKIRSAPRKRLKASDLISPWVSEITPINIAPVVGFRKLGE